MKTKSEFVRSLERLDAFAGRLNHGLAAVAVVLALLVGVMMSGHLATAVPAAASGQVPVLLGP